MGLSELALKLETASKKKEYDYCAEYFPEFKQKLLSLYERLSVISTDEEDSLATNFSRTDFSPTNFSSKEPGDTAYLKTHIEKALAAANDFDSDAGIEAINDLLVYDFGTETNSLLESTLDAFMNFDFDGAVKSLEPVK
jgi:hypothetical protein